MWTALSKQLLANESRLTLTRNGPTYTDPWPMWPIWKNDPFDPSTHDPLTHFLLWVTNAALLHLECTFQCVDVSSGSVDRTCRCRPSSLRRASGTSRRPWGHRSTADSRRSVGSRLVYSLTSRKTAGDDDAVDGCHGDVTLLYRSSTHLYITEHVVM